MENFIEILSWFLPCYMTVCFMDIYVYPIIQSPSFKEVEELDHIDYVKFSKSLD